MVVSAIEIDQYLFDFVCSLTVARNECGAIQEFLPQERYYKAETMPLNSYGAGPFVKFKIPRNLNESGVYVLTVEGQVKYIGETVNLSDRYNSGYGNISPRNCYKGGQETNCRINNLVYQEVKRGEDVLLWYYITADYKQIELELRRSHQAEWNKI